MNALQSILSHVVIWKLGWALLHSLWQVAAVAAVLAVALGLLRKASANVRYLVSCGALILMAALPIVTLWMVEAPPRTVVPLPEPGGSKPVSLPVVEPASVDIPLGIPIEVEEALTAPVVMAQAPKASYTKEELRRHLREYNMEAIRQGMPTLALPSTVEKDRQRVEESVPQATEDK